VHDTGEAQFVENTTNITTYVYLSLHDHTETPCHALVAVPGPLPYSVQARGSVSLCYSECP
jgi:hypothetical protein